MSLAARLTALTGNEARSKEAADRIRITCALPPRLTEQSRRLLMLALAEADRYGHDVTARGAHIWAEIAAVSERERSTSMKTKTKGS
ncbi:hypothetical protein [Streptomyces sp. NPDC016845]|uniref:hypothetical protein n=1 Tax=Streptomyces sp. NPDC016845 TaxID=3364972 RepID=UPI0037BB41F3